jgi:hypothetical protein
MEAVVELHALLTSRVIAATINGLNACANSFMYSRLSIQFCPPVVFIVALLYDSMIVTAVAFGLFLLKMGKIQNYLQNKVSLKKSMLCQYKSYYSTIQYAMDAIY